MMKSAIHENYFSEETLNHLKPQQGLPARYQRRVLDVTLACKLTHASGKSLSQANQERLNLSGRFFI